MNNQEFNPHDISWTAESAARIWRYYAAHPMYSRLTFSRMAGKALIKRLARLRIPIGSRAVDFGCGRGDLLEYLISLEVHCVGIELTPSLVSVIQERFTNRPYFEGAFPTQDMETSVEQGTIDCVFVLETVEHMLSHQLIETLSQLKRLLKNGGHIVVTTPNEEELENGTVFCPECGCIFHRGQHVRSWTRDELQTFMERNGFRTKLCEALTIREPSFLNPLRNLISLIRNHKKMNLIYAGQKY